MVAELLPFVVLVVVLALFGLVLRRMARLKKEMEERRVRLEAEAAGWGYRPAPDEVETVIEGLRSSSRFRKDRIEIPHLLARPEGDGTRYLAEYRSRGRSSDSSTERGHLFIARLGSDRMPRFALHHSRMRLPKLVKAGLDKVIQLRCPGYRPVSLETTHPNLEHSLMYAEEPDECIRLLSVEAIDALARAEGWGLESTGAWLLAEMSRTTSSRTETTEAILKQLAEFERLAEAFHA